MAESQGYEVPLLSKEELLTSLHGGTLGDIASNITAEHLKNPTSAVMMQLCLSILDRVGVEVDTLCHPMNDSYFLPSPDMYMNSFKILHVVTLIKKVLPEYVTLDFQLTDITSPTWKKVRKFICSVVNYFRSWDANMKTWKEICCKTDEAVAEHQKLEEEIDVATKEVVELEAHKEGREARYMDLKEKTDKMNRELEEFHQRKQEQVLLKQNMKGKLNELGSANEKNARKVEELKAEKERLMLQVVGSPKHDLAKKQALERKIKMMQETHIDWQSKLEEAEKKNKAMRLKEKNLADILQIVDDTKEIKERKTKLESEIQTQTYDRDNLELSLVELSQDNSNLRQQIAGGQERLSRLSARQKQRKIEFKSMMETLAREKENLESQAEDVHVEAAKLETQVKSKQAEYERKLQGHTDDIARKKEKQKQMMEEMDNFHIATKNKLQSSDVCKILITRNESK